MAERHRLFAWNATPLGMPQNWDVALKTLVPIMLASSQPMFIAWGKSRTLLYNDAYAEILAGKHPAALGCDFLDVWHEIRDALLPIVEKAYRGEPVQMTDIELWMERRGYREETHFSFFYAPVRAHSGEIAGFYCACTEITAQILAERRQAESEARHRGVLENMAEGFTLLDRDFKIVEVNAATERLVGLRRDELVGHNHWERFPGTFDAPVGRMYQRAMSEKKALGLEHLYRYPDGREHWYDVHAFPVGDGLAVVFQNVTHHKKLQEELSAAFERTQLALDAGAIVGTWVWNIAENLLVADERFAQSFGLDPSRLKHGAPLDYAVAAIHPDDRPRVEEAIARALQARGRYQCQYRVLRVKEYRWVEANGRVECDKSGAPARFPGVLLDIDERRRVEAERDRAAALLQTFISAVPGVVFAKDRQGRYLVANRGTAEAVGRSIEDIIGRTDAEVLSKAEEAAAVMSADREIMESDVTVQAEEIVSRADGTRDIWWSTKEPLHDDDGKVIGLIGSSVDITERRRMIDALQDAAKRKDEFLAMLAHELRNPLAPISAAAQLIKLSASSPERVTATSEIISRQVSHLTKLVDDLLDVSRVTRGLVQLEREPIDLRLVVSTAVEQVRPRVQSRSHELHIGNCARPITVFGDFHRLVQIVANLLNNAVKYTPHGGQIEVELALKEARAVISVRDNGIGIDPSMIDRVFELFTQAGSTPDRSLGGLGIGLALVRSLVHLHDGVVKAQSPGLQQGSVFLVELPLCKEGKRPLPVASPVKTGPHVRILIVDDNADAAATLAEVLQLSGHSADTALNGKDALALVDGEPRWDVFILDIGLPDMTGHELALRLRETPTARTATFIALTGYGQAHDRVLTKSSGFDHHFVKPADIPKLLDVLSTITPLA